MLVLTRIRALLRGTFWSSWKQGCFWVKLEKYLVGRKPRACGTNWYMIYEKIRQFLTKIDSKRFSSRYFQGCSLHPISFFPSDKFFPIFSNVKRIICAIKKIDHCAQQKTKDPGTCFPRPLLWKKDWYYVFRMRALIPLKTWCYGHCNTEESP